MGQLPARWQHLARSRAPTLDGLPGPTVAQMDRLHAIPANLKPLWDQKFLGLLYDVITDKKVRWVDRALPDLFGWSVWRSVCV